MSQVQKLIVRRVMEKGETTVADCAECAGCSLEIVEAVLKAHDEVVETAAGKFATKKHVESHRAKALHQEKPRSVLVWDEEKLLEARSTPTSDKNRPLRT